MATTVYFATNRHHTGPDSKPDFTDDFHDGDPALYRVGTAIVSDQGTVQSLSLVPETSNSEPDRAQLGSSILFDQIRETMKSGHKDILIYLHGYNNDAENSLKNAADLSRIYRINDGKNQEYSPITFAFLWPSKANKWKYTSDRRNAEKSGEAMSRALLRLIDFLADLSRDQLCEQRLHLIAHSMGNQALTAAVQGLRREVGDEKLRPYFHNIFLMAADEDDDALEPGRPDKLGMLPRLSRNIHVYHSADDLALVISDATKSNPDRLGFAGPRSFSGLSTRIVAIDCRNVDYTNVPDVQHQYYRRSKNVIADVCHVLSGRYRHDEIPGRTVIEPGRRFRITE